MPPAALTADGLVAVWSTMRLLIVRGRELTTSPLGCANEVPASAGRKKGSVMRGKT